MLSGSGRHRRPYQSVPKRLIVTATVGGVGAVLPVIAASAHPLAPVHATAGPAQVRKAGSVAQQVAVPAPHSVASGEGAAVADPAPSLSATPPAPLAPPAPAAPAAPPASPATSATAAQSGGNVIKTVSGAATYFGDSTEYQPLACGGNSRNITQGVALWTVPCGTEVRITSAQTGKSVVATVADRGPGSRTGAAIDLLPGTWDALGVSRGQGRQQVTYEVLGK